MLRYTSLYVIFDQRGICTHMTGIVPFRGIVYNNEKVAGDAVIAPPYDVIDERMRAELYGRSPYNVIRIDAGRDEPGDTDEINKYTRSAGYLSDWLAEGILTRSGKPAYYASRIDYEVDGVKRSLTGFFGLVKLVELGSGVYPHEATHSKPKADRLSLMEHTEANTSSIYSLVRAKGEGVRSVLARAVTAAPYLAATDPDGTRHSVWVVDGEAEVARMREALDGVDVFIADGHHRYETALEFRRMMREREGIGEDVERPYDYVLMFLAEVDDPGLCVLPTHRLVTMDTAGLSDALAEHFIVHDLGPDADVVRAIKGRARCFGFYSDGQQLLLEYIGRAQLDGVAEQLWGLDVVLLHKLVFGLLLDVGTVAYEMNPDVVRTKVDAGDFDAAFFLNPTAVADVERVARENLRMPPKSTYFYPKIQTGFVINSLTTF